MEVRKLLDNGCAKVEPYVKSGRSGIFNEHSGGANSQPAASHSAITISLLFVLPGGEVSGEERVATGLQPLPMAPRQS